MIISWIQFFSSIWMMTIIWFVQIVHYPLFSYIPFEARTHYAGHHQKKISWLVIPGMLIELGSLCLLFNHLDRVTWLGLMGLLTVIWASTFCLQVPCHQRLLNSPTDAVCKRLTLTNWIRTICWTLKTVWFSTILLSVMTH